MDTRKIEILLDKYYRAETTLDEEEILKKYFLENKSVEDKFKSAREQFLLMANVSQVNKPSDHFDEKIKKIIDSTTTLSLNFPNKTNWLKFAGIAAGILLVVGVTYRIFIYNNNQPDTFPNKEVAYTETQDILLYVSTYLNKGTKGLQNLNKLQTGQQHLSSLGKLNENLDKLLYLSKIDNDNN